MTDSGVYVSIVVPVYNVQSYVNDCLESLRGQDYKNFEVIIVDDGSTDNSKQIVEDFIQKYQDNRFRLYSKSNGGLSDARNFGLARCSDESRFVIFIDSDDEVTEDFVLSLIQRANDDSLVIGKLMRCEVKPKMTDESNENVFYEYNDIWNNELFLCKLKEGILNSACAKCYSLTLIRSHGLKFENTLPEDTLFNLAYARAVDTVVCLDKYVYYYFVRNQSMSTNPHECIYTNYIKIQKSLRKISQRKYHKYIDQFVYPQYRINTSNFIQSKDFSTPVQYLKNPLVKDAFASYSPISFGDWMVHTLMSHRLLKLISFIS